MGGHAGRDGLLGFVVCREHAGNGGVQGAFGAECLDAVLLFTRTATVKADTVARHTAFAV